MIHANMLEAELKQANKAFLEQLAAFDEESMLAIPVPGSWSAAMVAEHLVLSDTAIARWITGPGRTPGRNPGLHVSELENLFLNFSTKFQSPAFIIPTGKFKTKLETLRAFQFAASQVESLFQNHALDEICTAIDEAPLMGSTRLELFTFVMVHTKRHAHQLANIYKGSSSTPAASFP